jgi:hypothetical protein
LGADPLTLVRSGDKSWIRFGSSGISVGQFIALWYLPVCRLVDDIPVTHRSSFLINRHLKFDYGAFVFKADFMTNGV